MYENYLIHYGTLGMRWGKRKKQDDPRPKSKRFLKTKQKYLDKGLSDADSEIAAAKRIKIENIGLAFAGVTLAAAATYIAVNHYKNNVDKIIKSGTTLQNISTDESKDMSRAFYASLKNGDNTKYRGMYGSTLNTGATYVRERKFDVTEGLKLASPKTARKELSSAIQDPKALKNLKGQFEFYEATTFGKQKGLFKQATKDLDRGKVSKKVYDAFNLSLPDHTDKQHNELVQDFYSRLKQKGFAAIDDINDSKYSGYRSKKPIIVFDSKSVVEKSVRRLGEEEINKNLAKSALSILGEGTLKFGAETTAGILAVSGIKKVSSYTQEINQMVEKNNPKKY